MDIIPTALANYFETLLKSSVEPHKPSNSFVIERADGTYINRGLPIRLELASRFGANMVGTMDQLDVLRKSFELADMMIDKYNKDLNEPGQSE